MQLTIIAAIFVAITGVFFAMQNNAPVSINFLFWHFDGSLALVLLLAVAMGAVIVALLTTPATLRQQWLVGRQKRRIVELEKDKESLNTRISELEVQLNVPAEAHESTPPYVGLKQIIMSGQSDPVAKKDHPANG